MAQTSSRPVRRLALVAAVLTLLGLDAVYLQVQNVRLGYRVSQGEARLARLGESVRVSEIAVQRRREPSALQRRAGVFGVAPAVPAAGRVIRVPPRDVVAVRAPEDAAPRVAVAR